MSTVHNPYAIPTGLEDTKEDGQDMEASPTNSTEEAPTDSQDTNAPGEKPNYLTSNVLNGICSEETINFEDNGLFMMSPLFT